MAIVGTVTRVMGDTIADSQQTAQGNVGAFVAINADGVDIGSGRNAAEAQAIVNAGRGTLLRWTRRDLRGGVENYVGEDNT